MAVGSNDLTPEQLRGLDEGPLRDALAASKKELFNLRFQSATGQLESHGRLRAVRKDIARIYTEMNERRLGIGREPVEADTEVEAADADSDTADSDNTKEKVG